MFTNVLAWCSQARLSEFYPLLAFSGLLARVPLDADIIGQPSIRERAVFSLFLSFLLPAPPRVTQPINRNLILDQSPAVGVQALRRPGYPAERSSTRAWNPQLLSMFRPPARGPKYTGSTTWRGPSRTDTFSAFINVMARRSAQIHPETRSRAGPLAPHRSYSQFLSMSWVAGRFQSTGGPTQMNENRSEPKLLSTLLNPIKLLARWVAPATATRQRAKPFSILRHLRKTVSTEVARSISGC